MKLFTKAERSTFPYWFAHWCAYLMVALRSHVWKPKYLLHDIEKPFIMWLWKDYKKVQKYHRSHANHHIEYIISHPDIELFDIDAFLIDNECSRLTKEASPYTAKEYVTNELEEVNKNIKECDDITSDYYCYLIRSRIIYGKALKRLEEIDF